MVDSGNYREKYRRAIAEQERIEKQFKFQLDALKKTITHLSSAAQGLDKQLDASLILLKEKMRGASGQQVFEQMERVQSAATNFEHSRHVTAMNAAKHVGAMTEQLAELKIPPQLKTSLTSFSKGLKKRLDAYRNYPEVIQELKKLQEIALEEAANPPSSFWQRMKGGKTLASPEEVPEQIAPEGRAEPGEQGDSSELKEVDISEPEAQFEEVDTEIAPKEGELITAHEEDSTKALFNAGDEDSYQQVSQRIARTLENLVSRIEPNDVVRHKIDIVQLRIQRGMDWYVLAVTLEDIRDILLLRYLQNDQEFSEYLKRVNQELKAISDALGLASESEETNRANSEKFSNTVSDQVDKMRNNMENTTSIDDLKMAVTDHLAVIQGALGDYHSNKSTTASLTEQLRSLVQKVESVENESEKTKELLEEERYRATHDPLTELPNREAYNERAFHELQRFKRYCRPLTLAVCDIDRFKSINDTYGHQAGDKVLTLIAKLISTRLRKVDFVARYGGEEFVMLMPETPKSQALTVLDKVRAVIGKTPFKFKGSPVNITISFGLASFSAEDSVESVFERADKALYQAKDEGRNRCVIAEEDHDEPNGEASA
ncbi:MAG: GGDEF domain-containing protein [Agarilytica sp.]